ncbi:site-2 protease family protein [Patescibacteria group bacterium]|nr:site-2 protease family protein [Patescibacteria group bacterium]
MTDFYFKIFIYIIIILSAVFHEYAHGWAAYQLGDSTAKDEGRLTLNPLVHLDPIGTVILPLFLLFTSGMFLGWAKPVPYNPYNLRDLKYGTLKVAIAGPGANLLIALVVGLILRLFLPVISSYSMVLPFYLGFIVYVNIFLALFNLLPFSPLDGSKIFADLFPNQWRYFMQLGMMGIFLALFVAFFILSPIANFIFKIIVGQGFIF